jgi:uncharacterized protein (AIM24 family)
MKVSARGACITYYANEAQHVMVYHLSPGEVLSVESENILAFTQDCKYGVRFLAQGVISQKGLATSTLSAQGPNAYVAVLIDGNPLQLSNMENGSTIEVDPDAVVCWAGRPGESDPGFKLDLSWKNLIGQASGESYMLEYKQPGYKVIVQPTERKSGLDIGLDNHGESQHIQNNQSLSGAMGNVGDTLSNLGNAFNGMGGGGNSGGGLGGMLGGLFGNH